jgi:hypothetical protein
MVAREMERERTVRLSQENSFEMCNLENAELIYKALLFRHGICQRIPVIFLENSSAFSARKYMNLCQQWNEILPCQIDSVQHFSLKYLSDNTTIIAEIFKKRNSDIFCRVFRVDLLQFPFSPPKEASKRVRKKQMTRQFSAAPCELKSWP